MRREGDWVGDVGHLALADTALSELLIDMLRMLAHGDLFEQTGPIDPGLTTQQAARRVLKHRETHPFLVPDEATEWLNDVIAATEQRNEVMHAVALNRCINCGKASLFQHPRSGRLVDRSDDAVRVLTERMLDLRELGTVVAKEVARLVNGRIFVGAKVLANEKGETVVPETVHPTQVDHTCSGCNSDGRASARVLVSLAGPEVGPDADSSHAAVWLEALARPELLVDRNTQADEVD